MKLNLIIVAFLLSSACAALSKREGDSRYAKGMVITCQRQAAEIGISILKKGGNAADAYIATTLGEYVTGSGYTSLSGPLYLLYYNRKTQRTESLNAGLTTVSNPIGKWNVEANQFAACVLMPERLIRSVIVEKAIKSFTDGSIELLASVFHVSTQAMTIRLKTLGLI